MEVEDRNVLKPAINRQPLSYFSIFNTLASSHRMIYRRNLPLTDHMCGLHPRKQNSLCTSILE